MGNLWFRRERSVITNGPHQGKDLNELIAKYPEEILGHRAIQQFGKKFPLLIKFIDAQEPLSVQVTPTMHWLKSDTIAGEKVKCGIFLVQPKTQSSHWG